MLQVPQTFISLTFDGAAVKIRCPDHPSSDGRELTKKLPGTMTVQKLKGLVQRLYKVDTSEQKLSYLDEQVSRQFIYRLAIIHRDLQVG